MTRKAAPPKAGRKTPAATLTAGSHRALFENLPVAIYRTTPGDEIVDANPAMVALLGYPDRESLLRTRLGDIFPDAGQRRDEHRQLQAGGGTARYEIRLRRRDGRFIWVEDHARTITDGEGRIAGFEGVLVDITARRQVEEALHSSEMDYRRLFESAHDAIVVFDPGPGETILDANAQAADLYGFSRDELIGMSLERISKNVERGRERSRITMQDGVLRNFETVHFHRDGREMVIEINAARVKFQDRPAILSINRDISERKCAEEELRRLNEELDRRVRERTVKLEREVAERGRVEASLRESERKYRTLFEESKDAIFFSTPAGGLIDINPAGAELFGYGSPAEMIQAGVLAIYRTLQERQSFIDQIERDGFVKERETVMIHRDGRLLQLLETATAERDAGGRTVLYRGILRDVTNQRKLEQQLFQAQKMEALGLLAGGVAHDFNNLLTVILGNIEIGLMRLPQSDPGRHTLERIREASEKATALVQKLLAFGRQQVLRMGQVNPAALLRNFDPVLQRLIGEDIELSLELDADVELVWADPGAMEQVIMNLVVNAREAMPDGGQLTIQAGNAELDDEMCRRFPFVKPGRYVRLSVKDSGVGMDEVTQKRVFEPFFTTKTSGTGLGLPVVFSIVKQHKGYVIVSSRPGSGARFDVYLPVGLKTRVPESAVRRDVAIDRGRGMILLVEDDESVRSVLGTFLEGLGYTVRQAEDGEQAMNVFSTASATFDLLVMDIVMPRLSGPKVCELARQMRPDLPVLYISGYAQEVRERYLAPGSTVPLMLKPVKLPELSARVRELLAARDR